MCWSRRYHHIDASGHDNRLQQEQSLKKLHVSVGNRDGRYSFD
jgi:hypothetical protein